MALSVGEVQAILSCKDQLTPALKEAKAQLSEFGSAMKLAGTSLLPVSAGLAAIGLGSVKMATDFNASMANVATLIPNSTARVEDLKKSVEDMSMSVGKSTTDLSGGLYQVISAFGDSADTVKVLDINARAAAAGLSTTLQAIDLTSAVTKAYGDTSAAAVQKASDLAFITVKLGQTTFPQLASAIGEVAPMAATLHVSQEEMYAGFATLTGVTGDTATVSTQLAAILRGMMKPTTDMSNAIKELGFGTAQAMLNQLGMVGSLKALIGTTDGSAESVGKLFGRAEALNAVFALTGTQSQIFADKFKQLQDASGATDQAFKDQTQTVNQAGFLWAQLNAQLQVAGEKLGDALIPILVRTAEALNPIWEKVQNMIVEFGKLPQPVQTTVVAMAALAAAAGPVLYIFGILASTGSALMPIFTTVVGAITSVTTALMAHIAVAATDTATVSAATLAQEGFAAAIASTGGESAAGATAAMLGLGDGVAALEGSLTAATASTGLFEGALAVLTGPIGIAVAAVAGLIAVWYEWGDKIKPVIEEVYNWIKTWLLDKVEPVFAAVKGLLESVGSFFKALTDLEVTVLQVAANAIVNWYNEAKKYLAEQFPAVIAAVKVALEVVGAIFVAVYTVVKDTVKAIYEVVKFFLLDMFLDTIKGIKGAIDTMTGWFIEMKNKLTGHAQEIASTVPPAIKAGIADPAAQASLSAQSLSKDLDDMAAKTKAAADASSSAAKKHEDLVGELSRAKDIVERLTPSMQAQIKAGVEMGLETDKIAQKLGLTNQVVDLFKQKIQENASALKVEAQTVNDWNRMLATSVDRVQNVTAQLSDYTVTLDPVAAAANAVAIAHENLGSALNQAIATMAQGGLSADDIFAKLKAGHEVTDQEKTSVVNLANEMIAWNKVASASYLPIANLFDKTKSLKIGQDALSVAANAVKDAHTQLSPEVKKAAEEMLNAGYSADQVYNSLLKAGEVTTDDKVRIQNLSGGVSSLSKDLSEASKALSELAKVGGGFGSDIGAIATSISGANTALTGWKAASKAVSSGAMDTLSGIASFAGGVGTMISGVVSGVSSLWNTFFGSAGRDMVTQFADAQGGFDQMHSKLDALGDSGEKLWVTLTQGVGSNNTDQAKAAIASVTAALQQEQTQVDNVTKAISSGGIVWSKEFTDMVSKLQEAGNQTQQLDTLLVSQASNAAKGLTTFLKTGSDAYAGLATSQQTLADLQSQYASATGSQQASIAKKIQDVTKTIADQQATIEAAGVKTQASAYATAASIVGLYGKMIQSGSTATEAVKQMGPAIDALQAQLTATGLDGGQAFQFIKKFADTANDAVAGPVLDGVNGLKDAMVGLGNVGLLDQANFAALSSQVGQAYTQLVAQGKDGNAVLQLMQPTLQALWEQEQQFGYKADDATQALIDQAAESGIVGKAHEDSMKVAADAMSKVADLLQQIATKMGLIPADAASMADGVNQAISRIPKTVSYDVVANYVSPNYTTNSGSGEPGQPNNGGSQASGGSYVVTRPTVFLAGEAGPERVGFSGANNTTSGSGGIDMASVVDQIKSLERTITTSLPRVVRDAVILGSA